MVLCRNSGLGNMLNPLTSLNWPFRIPTLLITTWRGQPGLKDEPRHAPMGEIMHRPLDDLEGFEVALRAALTEDGPHLIHPRIAPGSLARLGRPTLTPVEVAQRFKAFLAGG